MAQSVELIELSSREKSKSTSSPVQQNKHTHTRRTREDLLWTTMSLIDAKEKIRVFLQPAVLGKGWEVKCPNPGRCLSHLAGAA